MDQNDDGEDEEDEEDEAEEDEDEEGAEESKSVEVVDVEICAECGAGPFTKRGLVIHRGRWCKPKSTYVCACTKTFHSWVRFNMHQDVSKCKGEFAVVDVDRDVEVPAEPVVPIPTSLSDRLRKRACKPEVDGTPIFPTSPEAGVPGSVSWRYVEQQLLKEAEAVLRTDETGVIREINEIESTFLLLATKYRLSNKCCEAVLKFARSLTPRGDLLRSYQAMRSSTEVHSSAESEYKTLRCHIPHKGYTANGKGHVDFEYIDILSVIVDLMTDPEVISSLDDFTQKSEVVEEDGYRKFTSNINSGRWQEDTEHILFGADGSAEITLGPIIVFIDGVALTKRGDQSAKPIMVTLAFLKPEVRQKKVCVC
jgi:hypothetical protein